MAMVDAACNSRSLALGATAVSDGGVFGQCQLSKFLSDPETLPAAEPLSGREKAMPFVVVADDAFPLRADVMKPYPQKNIGGIQRVFNYRLSRARRIVENAFGILSDVFRIFHRPTALSPEKATKLVLACCALHNFSLSNKASRAVYLQTGVLDQDNNSQIELGSWEKGATCVFWT